MRSKKPLTIKYNGFYSAEPGVKDQVIVIVPKVKASPFITVLSFTEEDKVSVVTVSILTIQSTLQLKSV